MPKVFIESLLLICDAALKNFPLNDEIKVKGVIPYEESGQGAHFPQLDLEAIGDLTLPYVTFPAARP